MNFRSPCAVIALLLILIVSLCAQTTQSPSSAETEEKIRAQQEREKKALIMLNDAIEHSRAFRLPENRLYFMTHATSILWAYDENRARNLFAEVVNQFMQLRNLPEDNPDTSSELQRGQLEQIRQEIIRMIAPHDTQAALDFLHNTRSSNNNQHHYELSLEISLAQQIAQKDPKRALQIAEEKLAKGADPTQFISLLQGMQQKDFESAQKLTEKLLGQMRTVSQSAGNSTSRLALNLLRLAPPPNEQNPGARAAPSGNETSQRYLITPAVARELIEKIFAHVQSELTSAEKQPASGRYERAYHMLLELNAMKQQVEKYAPSVAPVLKQRMAEFHQTTNSHQEDWENLNKLVQKGSIEALVEASSAAPSEMRFSYLERAANLAASQGKPELARQIINDNLSDSGQRRQLLAQLEHQALTRAANERKYDQARQLMLRFRNNSDRVNALMQMADSARGENKKELALQFLDEAWTMVSGPAETRQQFTTQMQLAARYVSLNPARSFEIIEASLDRHNELLAASVVLDSFENQYAFRDGEMIARPGYNRHYQLMYQYAEQLGQLAQTDPDRVYSIIGRFARPEIRLSLILEIVRRVLQQPGQQRGIPGRAVLTPRGL